MIVSAKSSQPVHLGNGTPLFDIMTAQVQFGFDDIAVQGLSCLAFEFPCNMEPADIECLLQLLQSDLFRDMGTDVHEQLVHHQMFTAALRAVLLRVDTGAQHEDDEHLQQALLKQCAGKAVVLLRQRDHAACQAFDEHGYLTVCPHSDAPEGHHVEARLKLRRFIRERSQGLGGKLYPQHFQWKLPARKNHYSAFSGLEEKQILGAAYPTLRFPVKPCCAACYQYNTVITPREQLLCTGSIKAHCFYSIIQHLLAS